MPTRSSLTRRVLAALAAPALLAAVAAPAAAAGRAPVAVPAPQLLVRAGLGGVVYVVAGSCGASSCALGLWRTNGDATSFVAATLPPVAPAEGVPTGTLQDLAFANPSDGLAVIARSTWGAATLYRTTDGGQRWVPAPLGSHRSVLGVATTAASFDLVTARCPGGTLACRAVAFQRGPAGEPTARLSSVALANQPGLGTFGASVTAFGDRVWIAEARRDGAPVLAQSDDAGATFAVHRDAPLVAVDTCALTATSSRSVWAQCRTGMLVSFFHSRDGGQTWGALSLGQLVAGTDGHAFDPVAGSLAYVHLTFPGPSLLRVQGPASAASRAGSGPFHETPSLAFVSRSDGLGIGGSLGGGTDRLAATDDGGASWRVVTIPTRGA